MGAKLTGMDWDGSERVNLSRLNYICQNFLPCMFSLRVGVKRQFAQDVVAGKEAAAVLFLCVEGRCWGSRMFMCVVASLLAHLIGLRQQLGLQLLHLPLDTPAGSLTPGPGVWLAP